MVDLAGYGRVLFISLSVSLVALTGCSVGAEEGSNETGTHATCPSGNPACLVSDNSDPNGRPAATNAKAPAPTPTDGAKNGDETDVDCGGSGGAPRCADDKGCAADSDCVSLVCKDAKCQAPRGDDGVKNGDETDVDCGGTTADGRCATGKACKIHSDCASDGCGYDGKCALSRSCAGHFGGDTCGPGEVGEVGAMHESCCSAAPISDAPNATMLDKYVVTAGRMRQFIERSDGNLRAFGESLTDNPNWKASWSEMLPASVGEAHFLLGQLGHGSQRAGCDLDSSRGRTYWMSDADNAAIGETNGHPFSKDVFDQKALNCVEFFMLQALCIWDGGRLATQAEIQTAWQGGERRVYPWGNDWTPEKAVWTYSYSFPEVYDQGNFVFVAAPGRFPQGNGKFGHSDLAGLVFEITSDVSGNSVTWGGNGSWEGHAIVPDGEPYMTNLDITRAYWATGGRCAHPR